MRRFLLYLFRLLCGVMVTFVTVALLSSIAYPIEWLFFQSKDGINTEHTLISIEESLADSITGGLLVVGSSVCENSIQPELLSELIGRDVHQMCTGGQSVHGALQLATFLNERIQPEAVLLDLYPRVADEQVIEGCMRVAIAHPDGRSALARFNALSIIWDWNLAYLWARSWVIGWLSPKKKANPNKIPGYLCTSNKPPMPPASEQRTVAVDAAALAAIRTWQLEHQDVELIVNLPPMHGASFQPLGHEPFIWLSPKTAPDSCFYDTHHMRCECSEKYTKELAASLSTHLN